MLHWNKIFSKRVNLRIRPRQRKQRYRLYLPNINDVRCIEDKDDEEPKIGEHRKEGSHCKDSKLTNASHFSDWNRHNTNSRYHEQVERGRSNDSRRPKCTSIDKI